MVRNAAYKKSGVSIRERHNERKNQAYSNQDIVSEYSHRNVHFKSPNSTYTEAFDKLCADGVISTRGLKADAKVIDEMIFDVNTAYFERHGGYDFAREFFTHAYEMAVKEAGGEQYILSAVMHADERNKSLSETLERDVFHYHLHVIYVPVVEKKILWTKRCKDKTLVGTVKETIMQVSNSKKWASEPIMDEHGKPVCRKDGKAALVSSYSRLQDRFFEHMYQAGYTDIERGEMRSGERNLSVAEFKAEQEERRASELQYENEKKEQMLQKVQSKLRTAEKQYHTFSDIENMGKRSILGQMEFTDHEERTLKDLAKECIINRGKVHDLEQRLNETQTQYRSLKGKYDRLLSATKEYLDAVKLAPQRIKEVLKEIFATAREGHELSTKKQTKINQRNETTR